MILKINDRIRNRKVEFFNDFRINLKYDAVGSTFGFKFYFDPDKLEHKEMACVGHVHKCTLEDDGELLLTGYLLSEIFSSPPTKQLVSIGGYSLPGVLENCQIPPSLYPLQSDGLSLKQIAAKYIAPFGLDMLISPLVAAEMDEPYEEATAKGSQTVKSYLAELASQKNIILSHDKYGRLLFTRAPAKQKPIFHFDGANIPGVTMGFTFNAENMHSQITVIKQEEIDEELLSADSTVMNPYIPHVFRPAVIEMSSTKDIDTNRAAKNALAKELKNMFWKISMDRWSLNDRIVRPGDTISVTNPKVYLYKKADLFVESVSLSTDTEKKTAMLHCVIPEIYNGQDPKYLFAGINLH